MEKRLPHGNNDIGCKRSCRQGFLERRRVATTYLKKLIGYDTGAFKANVEQPDKVKFYLFAMFTIIPTITGALGIVPLFFYDLNDKKKAIVYADLLERRSRIPTIVGSGDDEAIKQAADEQIRDKHTEF